VEVEAAAAACRVREGWFGDGAVPWDLRLSGCALAVEPSTVFSFLFFSFPSHIGKSAWKVRRSVHPWAMASERQTARRRAPAWKMLTAIAAVYNSVIRLVSPKKKKLIRLVNWSLLRSQLYFTCCKSSAAACARGGRGDEGRCRWGGQDCSSIEFFSSTAIHL